MNQSEKRSGFTLLELSIVLVIIGLVVGSIMVGQDLIDTSRLRAVESEATAYQSAFNTFYNKYNALPGDMMNPSSIFSEQVWYGGDGNGEIIWTGEGPEAWRQLALAGLIKGMTNINLCPLCIAIPNDTIPGSRGFNLAGWTVMYDTTHQRNILLFGAKSTQGDYMASDPALTGLQAQEIDTKYDDGYPETGTVLSKNITTFPACETSNKYDITSTSVACNFSIILGK